jgi:hypothetical protein
MYLFSNIKLQLGDKTIEPLNYPGQATTMLGLLMYPRGFAKAQGLNQLWCKDTLDELTDENQGYNKRQNYITNKGKGSFSFVVPLKHIFGFCQDYDNTVYGFNYVLTLTRQSDNDAIVRDATVGAGKVTLTKLDWMMPHVKPADDEKLTFFKTIQAKADLPVAFMARKCEILAVNIATSFSWTLDSKSSPNFPRYIIVGFQTNRKGNQTKNPALFDHCKVKSIKAVINDSNYPEVDYVLSFENNRYSRAYRDAAVFSTKLMELNELVTDSSIATDEYRDLYPLFVFDVSKQEEIMKYSNKICTIKRKKLKPIESLDKWERE